MSGNRYKAGRRNGGHVSSNVRITSRPIRPGTGKVIKTDPNEGVPGYIILFTYASYSSVWTTWFAWIRLRRPAPHSESLKDKLDISSLPTMRAVDMGRRPTSSFYAPHPGAFPLAPSRVLRSTSKRERWRMKQDQEKGAVSTTKDHGALGGFHVRHLGAQSVYGFDEVPNKQAIKTLKSVREQNLQQGSNDHIRGHRALVESTAPPVPPRNPRQIATALSRLRIPSSHPTPGSASPPFTWSITETAPPLTYYFSPSSPAAGREADDTSSISRYSTSSPSDVQLPKTRMTSI